MKKAFAPFFSKNKFTYTMLILVCCMAIGSLFIGVIEITPYGLHSTEQWDILIISRIPRLLAVICTGIGLSIAGLIMQNLCMNRFVSPSTGATLQSAQLGMLIGLIFLPHSSLIGRMSFAFLSAILGTWIFVWFIQKIQYRDVLIVPLIGIMFGNIISGITGYLAFKYDLTQTMASWSVGHFSSVLKGRYEIVYLVVPIVTATFYFARHFNIIGMGRNFSKNLGINYTLFLLLGLSLTSLLTASIVVVVGTVSYIGLIVPNLVSLIKGDNLKNTMLDTAICGVAFVLICDIISRIIIAPYELPINLVVGCIGSIIFIALIFYRLNNSQYKKLSFFNRLKKLFQPQPLNHHAKQHIK